MKRLCLLAIAMITLGYAQQAEGIDSVMTAMYGFIDGEKGSKMDSLGVQGLFLPEAQIKVLNADEGAGLSRSISVADFINTHNHTRTRFSVSEVELSRKVQQWGDFAQVMSPYRFTVKDGEQVVVEKTGVNWVQLLYKGDRWYVTEVYFQEATEERPLAD